MTDVSSQWRRIMAWLEANVSQLSLPGPAQESQIADAEQAIGMSFPEDLRASYLLHNGMEYGEEELNIFLPLPNDEEDMAFCLLPVEEIAGEWDVWRDLTESGDFEDCEASPDEGVANEWWSVGWIPVAGDGGGNFICVDMSPGKGGEVGQVICAWHDLDDRKRLAASWSEYLRILADAMEGGKVTYTEEGLETN